MSVLPFPRSQQPNARLAEKVNAEPNKNSNPAARGQGAKPTRERKIPSSFYRITPGSNCALDEASICLLK